MMQHFITFLEDIVSNLRNERIKLQPVSYTATQLLDPAIHSQTKQYPVYDFPLWDADRQPMELRVSYLANWQALQDIKQHRHDLLQPIEPLWILHFELTASETTCTRVRQMLSRVESNTNTTLRGRITPLTFSIASASDTTITGYCYLPREPADPLEKTHYYDEGQTYIYLCVKHQCRESRYLIKHHQQAIFQLTMDAQYQLSALDKIFRAQQQQYSDMEVDVECFAYALGAPLSWLSVQSNPDVRLSHNSYAAIKAIYAQYVYPLYNAVRQTPDLDQFMFLRQSLAKHGGDILFDFKQDCPIFDKVGNMLNIDPIIALATQLWNQYLNERSTWRIRPRIQVSCGQNYSEALTSMGEQATIAGDVEGYLTWLCTKEIAATAPLGLTHWEVQIAVRSILDTTGNQFKFTYHIPQTQAFQLSELLKEYAHVDARFKWEWAVMEEKAFTLQVWVDKDSLDPEWCKVFLFQFEQFQINAKLVHDKVFAQKLNDLRQHSRQLREQLARTIVRASIKRKNECVTFRRAMNTNHLAAFAPTWFDKVQPPTFGTQFDSVMQRIHTLKNQTTYD